MQYADMEFDEATSVHKRLKWARIQAGFRSAMDAARWLKIPYGTYSGHENGSRGIKNNELERYAGAFGYPFHWLLTGTAEHFFQEEMISVIGAIGHKPEAEFEEFSDQQIGGMINVVGVPKRSGCVIVMGASARGIAPDGSLIYCQREFSNVSETHMENLCLCKLKSGKIYLRFITPGRSNNLYDLEAPLFETMKNQDIQGISLVHVVAMPSFVTSLQEGHIEYVKQIAAAGREAFGPNWPVDARSPAEDR